MNWGKGIITGMIAFMLFIIAMCIYMFMIPTDDYDHQYYEKGLTFNQVYNKEDRVNIDRAWPNVYVSHRHLKMSFVKAAKGTVKFLRPSSTSADRVQAFNSGSSIEVDIPVTNLAAGKWQIELDWVSNNKTYFQRQEIYIQ